MLNSTAIDFAKKYLESTLTDIEKLAKAKMWIKHLINHCEDAADIIEEDGLVDEEDIKDERGFIQEAREFYASL